MFNVWLNAKMLVVCFSAFHVSTSPRNLSLICKQLLFSKAVERLDQHTMRVEQWTPLLSLSLSLTPFILAQRQLLVVGGNNLPKAKTKFINHRHRGSQFRDDSYMMSTTFLDVLVPCNCTTFGGQIKLNVLKL